MRVPVELDLLRELIHAYVSIRPVTPSGASTLGRGRGTGPQIVASPPNLAVPLTHCGHLILRKIGNFDATGCHILRLKCTKFDFCCDGVPPNTPLGELTVLPQTS